ncbi:hypothetical protein [Clostridium pasteurianum]|uniref:Uncharacterized protein n=1 Tax=Clostridium pasteurianum BC1 TaxID=86416 RepID=R4JZS6_CLOPA|nr:hypothetical protein [Clostridium pasteurianum]AGK95823.1 hypothetical protein Clopa_0794 [Clostridium pasteurianum BC1]
MENLNNDLLKAIEVMLKKELQPIKTEVQLTKTEAQSMKTDIQSIKTQLDENTQILKALEHKADVNKAEHDKMSNDIAHIKGDIEGLRKDITNVEIITSSNWNDIAKLKSVK